MPELVKLYIRNVLIGFGLSAVFVAILLWSNVANLQHLVLNSGGAGYLALFLLFFFNGLVFAGVQFAIAVMGMAEPSDSNSGGRRDGVLARVADFVWPPRQMPVRIRHDDQR